MAAYCIGQITVKDGQAWEEYRSRVGATIVQYGGQVLFRGGLQRAFSGAADHDSVVALRFESLAAANRWHDSPEYQALIPLREQGALVTLTLYEE